MGKENQEGVDPKEAGVWQYNLIERFGWTTDRVLTMREAFAIERQIRDGEFNGSGFTMVPPTERQAGLLRRLGYDVPETKRQASHLLSAHIEPIRFLEEMLKEVMKAQNGRELTRIAREIMKVRIAVPDNCFVTLVEAGRRKREELDAAIPE